MWSKSGTRNTILDAPTINDANAPRRPWRAGAGADCRLRPAFTNDGDDCILRFATIGKATDNEQADAHADRHDPA
jgi:hypothetical protein